MSSLEIRELDLLGSPETASRVSEIVGSELGGVRSSESIAKTIDFASGTTRLLGGYVGNELVCLNAFMRLKFTLGSTSVFGYQSGFSATDKNHRGKGYWPSLLRAAEDHLAASDGSFIFGFPNPVSHPLFERKLNYSTMGLFNVRIACLPFIVGRAFKGESALVNVDGNRLSPDLDDNIDWKRRSDADGTVLAYQLGSSFLWGKLRSAVKFGIAIKFLEVGGFKLAQGEKPEQFFRSAAKFAGVRFVYVSMNVDNQYFGIFNFRGPGAPVIVKPLGGFQIENRKFDFFGGMRDTF